MSNTSPDPKNQDSVKIQLTWTRNGKSEIQNLRILLPPLDYPLGHNPEDFLHRLLTLYRLLVCKGFTYQDSWKKRGELRSIIPNIDRKDDRYNVALERAFQGEDSDRVKCDAGVDGAMYRLLHVLDYLQNSNPDAFNSWWNSEVLGYIQEHEGSI